jgi:hypothetical protein
MYTPNVSVCLKKLLHRMFDEIPALSMFEEIPAPSIFDEIPAPYVF